MKLHASGECGVEDEYMIFQEEHGKPKERCFLLYITTFSNCVDYGEPNARMIMNYELSRQGIMSEEVKT
jgi:hypothetical protein